MKKLTAEDLKKLEFGDKVHRFNGTNHIGLRYVGRMPGSEDYLIFSNGEHLEHLYISTKDNSFKGDWYGGDYDSEFIGKVLIEKYQEKIKSVQRIYFKEDGIVDRSKYNMDTWEGIFGYQAATDGANYTLLKEWLEKYFKVPQFINVKEFIKDDTKENITKND